MVRQQTQGMVSVQTNAEDVADELEGFAQRIPDEVNSEMGEMARDARKRLEMELYRQGSVKTFTGVNSLIEREVEMGDWIVEGAAYLKDVDTGTMAHYPAMNKRFRQWAKMEGWEPTVLARHIAHHGTKPHPFINRALRPVIETAQERGVKALVKAEKKGKHPNARRIGR